MQWGISTLADGRIHGSGYNYKVDGSSEDCAEKLIIKGGYKSYISKEIAWLFFTDSLVLYTL